MLDKPRFHATGLPIKCRLCTVPIGCDYVCFPGRPNDNESNVKLYNKKYPDNPIG